MSKTVDEIGLAVIGCGTIGRIRAEFARDYPGVKWLGLCDIKEDLGKNHHQKVNLPLSHVAKQKSMKSKKMKKIKKMQKLSRLQKQKSKI